MATGDLVKRMTAHFQRIVEIKSLVVGSNNEIITSSIDRCIKIWNLDYIFEKERHIDKHELTIDALSISTSAGIAVTVTRSCLGVWDFMTGHLLFKLNNSALGAIITHGLVNEVRLCRPKMSLTTCLLIHGLLSVISHIHTSCNVRMGHTQWPRSQEMFSIGT